MLNPFFNGRAIYNWIKISYGIIWILDKGIITAVTDLLAWVRTSYINGEGNDWWGLGSY